LDLDAEAAEKLAMAERMANAAITNASSCLNETGMRCPGNGVLIMRA